MSIIKSVFRTVFVSRGIRRVTRQLALPFISERVKTDISAIMEDGFNQKSLSSVSKVTYIRSDFWLKNSNPNGAVAHTEGVVNAMVKMGCDVDLVSTFPLPFLKDYHSFDVCTPDGWVTGISELEEIEYNRQLYDFLLNHNRKADLVYQRYGRNNYAGLTFAHRIGVPFVLEYNGSEIWMSRNWGHSLRFESLTEEIENCVLTHADLVVGNADAFKEELLGKGVKEERILIIPNGVDLDRFDPALSGEDIRASLGFSEQDIVVTFVGSFGPWHGAEILAQSIRRVVKQCSFIKFLFIGDGARLVEVKRIVSEDDVSENVIFTGLINREIVPRYLAASDIVVSPQVPNPDGSPFFGSPTKLFEYMSMGKAIIASDLDQIGTILTSYQDSILVPPGNVGRLAEAILLLATDSNLRTSIGMQARKVVEAKYSWDSHVRTILGYLSKV